MASVTPPGSHAPAPPRIRSTPLWLLAAGALLAPALVVVLLTRDLPLRGALAAFAVVWVALALVRILAR